jgi:hypothetical protein
MGVGDMAQGLAALRCKHVVFAGNYEYRVLGRCFQEKQGDAILGKNVSQDI